MDNQGDNYNNDNNDDDKGDAELQLEVLLPHVFTDLVGGLVEERGVILERVCPIVNIFQHFPPLIDGLDVIPHHAGGVVKRRLKVLQLGAAFLLVWLRIEGRRILRVEFSCSVIAEGVVWVVGLCTGHGAYMSISISMWVQ